MNTSNMNKNLTMPVRDVVEYTVINSTSVIGAVYLPSGLLCGDSNINDELLYSA